MTRRQKAEAARHAFFALLLAAAIGAQAYLIVSPQGWYRLSPDLKWVLAVVLGVAFAGQVNGVFDALGGPAPADDGITCDCGPVRELHSVPDQDDAE